MDEANQKAFDDEWNDKPRQIIRVEMIRKKMSFAELRDRLEEIEVVENERNLRNKVARGSFSAVFFLQCLVAMGIAELNLDEENWPHTKVVSRSVDPADPRNPDNWLEPAGPRITVTRADTEGD